MRVFGKTDAEIDRMIASRKIDPALVRAQPDCRPDHIDERAAGLLVQPGNPPAPYTVANVASNGCWRMSSKATFPLFHLGQPVQVKVMAYPDRVFKGRVSKIYARRRSEHPPHHRPLARFADPQNELRPGMLANFRDSRAETGGATADTCQRRGARSRRHHDRLGDDRPPSFAQRIVKTGLRKDGRVQILDGLQPGELVVATAPFF